MEKKLYKDEHHKMIAGVCAGLADYLNIDVTIIRVFFVFALIFHGGGGLLYIVLMIVLPKKGFDMFTTPADPSTVDYRVPPLPPLTNTAFGTAAPKKASSGGVIAGVILILIGGAFLLDNFDFIPDFDFGQWWPVIPILAGLGLMIAGTQKKPWHNNNWQTTPNAGEDAKAEEPLDNNNPTV